MKNEKTKTSGNTPFVPLITDKVESRTERHNTQILEIKEILDELRKHDLAGIQKQSKNA